MSGAVFLSYASQDAEAARRICEALRSGGVEVWFDQDGGLEHGDEWDAKIRTQIKDCVLFIPLISANTQARHEGYFRLEWELAAQRAMSIAAGVPFILPVVIDDTREPDALVPDRFQKVQWTRLQNGIVPSEVLARFLKLWSHRTGLLSQQAARRAAAGSQPASEMPSRPATRSRGNAYAVGIAAVVLVTAAIGWWLVLGRKSPDLPTSSAIVNESTAKAPPFSEVPQSAARQLATKAWALLDSLDSTRDDFLLAEDLLKQAVVKDGTDAEVWACYSQLHNRFVVRGWDGSDQRKEAASVAAQRALRLDPRSFEARLAQAGLAGDSQRELEENEREWRALHRERPTDQRVLRSLAIDLRKLNRLDEACVIYDESAAMPGGDPLALYDKSLDFWFVGRTVEAEAAMRAAMAQKPFSSAQLMTVWYAILLHGDLDGALATLNQIAPAALREDRGCFFAYSLYMLRHEPDAALERLHAVPRDWLNDNFFRGPKGRLAGNALNLAGRTDAAELEWRTALKQVDARLAAAPTNIMLLQNRILLLASLGEREEATRQLAVALQMLGLDPAGNVPVPHWVTYAFVLFGRQTEAIQQIRRGLKQERRAVDYTAAVLRLDPSFNPLRAEPEFQKVIAEAEAMEAAATPASASPKAKQDLKVPSSQTGRP